MTSSFLFLINFYNIQSYTRGYLSYYKRGNHGKNLELFFFGPVSFLEVVCLFVFNGNQHATGLNRQNDRKNSDCRTDEFLSLLCLSSPKASPDHAVGSLAVSPPHGCSSAGEREEVLFAGLLLGFQWEAQGQDSGGLPSPSEPSPSHCYYLFMVELVSESCSL